MVKNTSAGRAKLAALLDDGSFVEIGAYIKKSSDSQMSAGVITGFGAIDGRLVYLFVQDSDNRKGAVDAIQINKIAQLYKTAIAGGAPVIGIFDSAGAIIEDGAGAMDAYGRFMKIVADASGIIPQIAVISGACTGMSAAIASMFDFTVMVKGQTRFYVSSPFILEDGSGTAEYASQNGLASLTAESEEQAYTMLRQLFAYLPSNNLEDAVAYESHDDINRTLEYGGALGQNLIKDIADDHAFVEIGAAYGRELCVGFASIGYQVCGIVASNAGEKDGALSADGMRKAAKFVSFCDSFDIPLVTLVNSVGLVVDRNAERDPAACAMGRLAQAYATSQNAKITVVVGKAYGAAFTLLGSKALGSDLALAVDDAEISIMPPSAAVAFLWNDKITPEVSRSELEKKWATEKATAFEAASCGAIDDIVSFAELRQRICAGLYMLSRKSTSIPERRHVNLPL